jgi:hypothetical protein
MPFATSTDMVRRSNCFKSVNEVGFPSSEAVPAATGTKHEHAFTTGILRQRPLTFSDTHLATFHSIPPTKIIVFGTLHTHTEHSATTSDTMADSKQQEQTNRPCCFPRDPSAVAKISDEGSAKAPVSKQCEWITSEDNADIWLQTTANAKRPSTSQTTSTMSIDGSGQGVAVKTSPDTMPPAKRARLAKSVQETHSHEYAGEEADAVSLCDCILVEVLR